MERNENGLLKNNQQLGVIICRMQVPYLTDSHQKMIKTVQDRHPRILILLGVAKDSQITERDPFTYDFRKQMLQQYLRPHDDIQGLLDCPESDEKWVKLLDHTVEIYCFPGETAILYGGRESFIPYYLGHGGLFKTQELAPAENDSGTALREIVATLPPIYSPDAACAILWYQKKLREQGILVEVQKKDPEDDELQNITKTFRWEETRTSKTAGSAKNYELPTASREQKKQR